MAKKRKDFKWTRKSKKSKKKPVFLSVLALTAGGAIGKVFLSNSRNR